MYNDPSVEVVTEFVEQMMAVTMVAIVVAIALTIIPMWKIMTKAGEKGWKSLIPMYNSYIMYKIAWEPKMFWITLGVSFGLSFLSEFIPFIGILTPIFAIVIQFLYCKNLSESFGYKVPFAIGLFFIPIVFQFILAFGSAKYVKNQTQTN